MKVLGSDVCIDMRLVRAAIVPSYAARHADALDALRDTISSAAQPEVVYRSCDVVTRDAGTFELCGVAMGGPLLRYCLTGADVAYPFVFTLGPGVDTAIRAQRKPYAMYVADMMANALLASVRRAVERHLCMTYNHGAVSKITPGSLDTWPIGVQRTLLGILSRTRALPVRIEESNMMNPLKSVSGIYFPSDLPFGPCMLCKRDGCIGREYPYDPLLDMRITGNHHPG